jgi:hypothetical protein
MAGFASLQFSAFFPSQKNASGVFNGQFCGSLRAPWPLLSKRRNRAEISDPSIFGFDPSYCISLIRRNCSHRSLPPPSRCKSPIGSAPPLGCLHPIQPPPPAVPPALDPSVSLPLPTIKALWAAKSRLWRPRCRKNTTSVSLSSPPSITTLPSRHLPLPALNLSPGRFPVAPLAPV